jgi:hypothetical protein
MFLSPEQLERLTGRKQPAAQIRWLNAHGWRYTRNAIGEVIVMEAEARWHLYSGRPERPKPRTEPNFAALFENRPKRPQRR